MSTHAQKCTATVLKERSVLTSSPKGMITPKVVTRKSTEQSWKTQVKRQFFIPLFMTPGELVKDLAAPVSSSPQEDE